MAVPEQSYQRELVAGEAHIGSVGAHLARPSATFTRPSPDTTTYTIGDLVANSATAGSVVPMQFTVGRIAAGTGILRRVRLRKSGTTITNASFRLHLYANSPTPSNGDNGVWLTDGVAGYLGSFDVTCDKVFTDGASGNGLPSVGNEITFVLASGQILYGFSEARAAYAPAAGESFTYILEDWQS